MTFVLATLVYPIVLAVLCVGAGLLVDRISGRFLPLAVMPALGLALLIGVSQLTTDATFSAPATPFVMVAVALAGWWLGRARLAGFGRRLRRQPWPVLAMVGTYVVALAPILFAGRPSLSLYLTDTVSSVHIAGADFLLHHGRDYGSLDPNVARSMYLINYFSHDYPSGGHTMFGGSAWLIPVRFIWTFQPYMAFVLAAAAGPLWVLMRRVGLVGWWAGLGALVASVPALVYAFDLVGSMKELTALPLIVLTGVLVADHAKWLAGRWFAGIPIGVVCGAGLSAIGVAFGAWAAVVAVVLVGVMVVDPRLGFRRWKSLALLSITAIVAGVLMAVPVIRSLAGAFQTAEGIASTADPGNLSSPLYVAQMFGVWLNESYRGALGENILMTYALIGVVAAAVVLGIGQLVRRRNGALTAWALLLGVLWVALTLKGTTWTDAKMLVLISPVVALLAWSGVAALRDSRRVVEALILALVITGGVLYSDALQYHGANLAPTARFDELASINDRFGGDGPTLLPDFDEYAIYELRDMAPSAPGFAFKSAPLLAMGVPYGGSVDLDAVPLPVYAGYPTLVVRRAPTTSRPPSDYRLAWTGTYYEVWTRQPSPKVLAHVGASGPGSASGVVRCRDVKQLARTAREAGGRLAVARRPKTVTQPAALTAHSPGWRDRGDGGLDLYSPGQLITQLTVPHAGRWNLWLRGQVGRPLVVTVDGRKIGTVGEQTAGIGNYLTPLPVTLTAGPHDVSIIRPGGSPDPNDKAPSWLDAITLAPVAEENGTVKDVDPADYRSLCGRPVDWIEAVKP